MGDGPSELMTGLFPVFYLILGFVGNRLKIIKKKKAGESFLKGTWIELEKAGVGLVPLALEKNRRGNELHFAVTRGAFRFGGGQWRDHFSRVKKGSLRSSEGSFCRTGI
jgi:hypothetical protein